MSHDLSKPVTSVRHVESWPAPPALRVLMDHGRTAPRDPRTIAAVENRWEELVAANPRMFNGPLLTVVGADLESGLVECRRGDFKHLAVQDKVSTGTEILAVSGVVIARDRAGREHVLLGRRARQTRVYGGMWELGPSGGMPVPPDGVGDLCLDDFVRHLDEEMREEVGLELEGARCVCAGFCRDFIAHSLDVMVRVEVRQAVEDLPSASRDWEYEEVRWIALDDIGEFDRAHADQIIPPTRAFWRSFGWARE